MDSIRTDRFVMRESPYRHLVADSIVTPGTADDLLLWLESGAAWKPKSVQDFYDSDDIDLRTQSLPANLAWLVAHERCAALRDFVASQFDVEVAARVDVTAHRLKAGQRIGVHTDHGEVPQSHRLLVQLNRGWTPSQGGLLMMFGEPPSSVDSWMPERAYLPVHGSSVCFEVSSKSWHAVSAVSSGDRYTLCVSFYCSSETR